jgi:hypothetical protein
MKLHEEEHTIQGDVTSLDQLRDASGEYLAGTVNVAGHVDLFGKEMERLPVKFGAVGGSFYCGGNRLPSLEGAPGTVGGNFYCNYNRLTSLEGAPRTVGGSFYCDGNKIAFLRGIHGIVKRIDGTLNIKYNPIASGGIGLLLVEGLSGIGSDLPALEIINKYFGQGRRGLLRCQEALADAGFEEHARL